MPVPRDRPPRRSARGSAVAHCQGRGVRCPRRQIPAGPISEETFASYLYAPDVPDPDLILRTSGEFRLSNFLLWEAAYSELYVTPVLWPDFEEKDFIAALDAFALRSRRFGGVEAADTTKGNKP